MVVIRMAIMTVMVGKEMDSDGCESWLPSSGSSLARCGRARRESQHPHVGPRFQGDSHRGIVESLSGSP